MNDAEVVLSRMAAEAAQAAELARSVGLRTRRREDVAMGIFIRRMAAYLTDDEESLDSCIEEQARFALRAAGVFVRVLNEEEAKTPK